MGKKCPHLQPQGQVYYEVWLQIICEVTYVYIFFKFKAALIAYKFILPVKIALNQT